VVLIAEDVQYKDLAEQPDAVELFDRPGDQRVPEVGRSPGLEVAELLEKARDLEDDF